MQHFYQNIYQLGVALLLRDGVATIDSILWDFIFFSISIAIIYLENNANFGVVCSPVFMYCTIISSIYKYFYKEL